MNKISKTNIVLLAISGLNISFNGLTSCTSNKTINEKEKTVKFTTDEHCEINTLQEHVINGKDYIVDIKYLDDYILDNIKVTINNNIVNQNVAYVFNDDQTMLTIFSKYITGNIDINIKTKKNPFLNPDPNDVQELDGCFYEPNTDPFANYPVWIPNAKKHINVKFFKQTSFVPYISIKDMFAYDDDTKNLYECVNDENNITKIRNVNTNKIATIDAKQQKIIFDDWDKFICISKDKDVQNNPLALGCDDSDYYLKISNDPNETEYKAINNQFELNLKNYNINIFYYKNMCYLPYDLYFELLFNSQIQSTYVFNKNGFYKRQSANLFNLYNELDTEWIDEQYLEYNYNMLALKLDNLYGLQERLARTNNYKPIKYLYNGAYTALEPYKTRLTSLEHNKSNQALSNFVIENLDDGGHTSYNNVIDLLSTIMLSKQYGPEHMYTSYVLNNLNEARQFQQLAPENIITNPPPYMYQIPDSTGKYLDAYLNEYINPSNPNDIILYLVFDGFDFPELDDQGNNWSDEPVKYENVDDTNYYFDTIRLTMYADKLVKKYKKDNKNISVVIDVSDNGGGSVFAEYFIASWLCGGVKQTMENPRTKAFNKFTIHADVNSDNKFDENDYLPNDVKVYCITSNGSFSAANMLSINLMENKKDNMFFIGEQSGGGACFVGEISTPIGSNIRTSSYFHLLTNSSTFDNRLSADVGTKDTTYFYPISNNDAIDFFDRDEINKKIWNNI